MSDSDEDNIANAMTGAMLGLIVGALVGVCVRVFAFEDASFSPTVSAFVSAATCGTLGMIFGKPVTKCFNTICRWWFVWP